MEISTSPSAFDFNGLERALKETFIAIGKMRVKIEIENIKWWQVLLTVVAIAIVVMFFVWIMIDVSFMDFARYIRSIQMKD